MLFGWQANSCCPDNKNWDNHSKLCMVVWPVHTSSMQWNEWQKRLGVPGCRCVRNTYCLYILKSSEKFYSSGSKLQGKSYPYSPSGSVMKYNWNSNKLIFLKGWTPYGVFCGGRVCKSCLLKEGTWEKHLGGSMLSNILVKKQSNFCCWKCQCLCF